MNNDDNNSDTDNSVIINNKHIKYKTIIYTLEDMNKAKIHSDTRTGTTLKNLHVYKVNHNNMDERIDNNILNYSSASEHLYLSDWDKYIDKIHNMIMNMGMGMCMIERNNIYRKYVDIYNPEITITYECRFKGLDRKRHCEATYVKDGVTIYNKVKTTPKKLYNSMKRFIRDICG